MKVGVLFLTDGRWECAERTIQSFKENWDLPYTGIIVNDSTSREHAGKLAEAWPEMRQLSVLHEKRGFAGAIGAGWESMRGLEVDFIFHLEDDFLFNGPIPAAEMIQILQENPTLAQVALKRQAWNEEEKSVGGIIEQRPHLYHEKGDPPFCEHDLFFTTNPCIYPVWVTGKGWPRQTNSEGNFGARLRAEGFKFAFWGKKTDPPMVHHIGEHRTGTGY